MLYEVITTDWLGFDDGTRRNPIDPNDASMNPNTTVAILARGIHNHPEGPNYRNALESFNPVMAAKKETSFMDYNLGIAMGNQQVKKKVTLGYNLALSYKSETDFYQDAIDSKYALANGDPRITSYNVCYTKLLRDPVIAQAGTIIILDTNQPDRIRSLEGPVRASKAHRVVVDHP